MAEWSELRRAESFLRHGIRGPEFVALADVLMDEYDRRGAAIQRVRELATTEAVLDHSRGWVVLAGAVLCALDGDTTEEQR